MNDEPRQDAGAPGRCAADEITDGPAGWPLEWLNDGARPVAGWPLSRLQSLAWRKALAWQHGALGGCWVAEPDDLYMFGLANAWEFANASGGWCSCYEACIGGGFWASDCGSDWFDEAPALCEASP